MCRTIGLALGLAALIVTTPAWAQDQTELKTDADQERTARASGDDESFAAKAKRIARETQIIERLNGEIDGWYPKLGGMTTGSGFAMGPGYRTHVLGDQVLVDFAAAVSTKAYKMAEAKARWLQALDRRLEFWTYYRYQNYTQEDFFGLGVDTPLSLQTNYELTSHDVAAYGHFNLIRWFRVGADLGYFMPTIGAGHDSRFPSTELLFGDADAPGLTEQPNFLHTTLFAEADFRDEPGNPRSGAFYRTSYGTWNDVSLEQFDFHKFEGEAAHFIPLRSKTHVLANRIGFAYVNNAKGARVPFYFLPHVGGNDTVRSYEEFRFKDENALWINTEYRWAVWKYVDLAAFFDAGEVRADWEEIGPRNLRTGYGFGVRFGTSKRIFGRMDFGFGGEGTQFFFKMGPSF